MPSIKSILLLGATVSQIAFVIAAPIPQLAGEGAACDSILSSTDNGVGYGVENAEGDLVIFHRSTTRILIFLTDNIASSIRGGKVNRRQLAGEGAACNSVLSSTDNGVGYGVENAEDNTAALVGGKTSTGTATGSGSTGGSNAAPAPGPGPAKGNPKPAPKAGPKVKRQADKIANGAANIINALGQPQLANTEQTQGDNLDGQLTSDAASIGAQVGASEESTLINAAKAIARVKRQGDKVANGAANVINALGQGQLADVEQSTGDNLDSQLTSDAADAGAQLGSFEEITLVDAGNKIARS
jgi:hypothetical protein